MDTWTLIGAVLLILVGASIGLSRWKGMSPFSEEAQLRSRMINAGKPPLWLFYDLSEVNSRWWMDFMGRSSRAINLPYLNLCYQTIVKHGSNYDIRVLSGLEDIANMLGGWEKLPSKLRDVRAPIGVAEKAWIRATVLEKEGGLWLEPSVIAMSQIPLPEGNKVIFYGTDADQLYIKQGTEGGAPSFQGIFSPRAGHPVIQKMLEMVSGGRLDGGGKQIRKDDVWDYSVACADKAMCGAGAKITLDRKANGKRIELEDFLATVDGIPSPFKVPANTVFIPLPAREILDFRSYGWFARMSEEQILDAPLAISALFNKALGK
jgi:hypothetical protein